MIDILSNKYPKISETNLKFDVKPSKIVNYIHIIVTKFYMSISNTENTNEKNN